MQLNEIIQLAAFYLGLDESDGKASAQLCKCANLAVNEICADHYPLTRETTVQSGTGKIAYSELAAERVLEVLSVKRGGENTRFRSFHGYIKTEPNITAAVRFAYLPGEYAPDEAVPIPDKIGARIVAYGAAAEYCLINGLFEEAVVWEKRYKDSLAANLRKRGEITVPARRWL
ncbi:MAG: hypothetical protein LBL66_07415 [Clostridiales bacterium]|jgi:hypothetical protein|nr:hypothetical protein [Clostridiales bacterium]